MVAGAGVVLMSRQSGSSSGILGDAGVEQNKRRSRKAWLRSVTTGSWASCSLWLAVESQAVFRIAQSRLCSNVNLLFLCCALPPPRFTPTPR